MWQILFVDLLSNKTGLKEQEDIKKKHSFQYLTGFAFLISAFF